MKRTFVRDSESVEHNMSNSPVNAWGAGQCDLVAEAKSLVPLLRSFAVETEQLGRLPERSAEALRRAGFFSLFASRRFGGHETSPRTAAEVLAELGRGDGSTAWVAAMLSATAYLVSLLGEEGRRDVWGGDNAQAGVCGALSLTGTGRAMRGGLVVSGSWQPMTGVHEARRVGVVERDDVVGGRRGVLMCFVATPR